MITVSSLAGTQIPAAAADAADSGATKTVVSPNGRLAVTVDAAQTLKWSLSLDGKALLAPSPISMTLSDGTVYGSSGDFEAVEANEEDNNALVLRFADHDLIFRVFDNGAAYRFVSKAEKPFEVVSEQATFALPGDWNLYVPYVREDRVTFEQQFNSSFESQYTVTPVSGWNPARMAFLPLLVEAPEGVKLCITETDLTDYPGMYLYNGDGSTSLTGKYAPYPKELVQGGHNNLQMLVQSREDYIARCSGATNFPWRIVAVSERDSDLLANDLPFRLATPPAEGSDFSWVRPGKVAWEWWNDWNIGGVDFKSGINNDTYKYYIDFASEHGIEYVILDEGWAVNLKADLMQVVPEIDLEELVHYAAERNVGIILWAGYRAFERDMEEVCRHYSEMGVKGFKVDFMDRDDQIVVNFERRAAEVAAKYRLMLDFHGTFKPSGLHRTFPNVVNYEGVFGLEQMKWCPPTVDQVTYDVTIPYIRMFAGPLDYTQGAMRNATKSNYFPVNSEPMSQGTRCRQLAEYVVFKSPLNMLCDSPTAYLREPECLSYIAAVPTVWDETVPLGGEVGKWVAVARRSGGTWYVGAMTDWDAREVEIDLSFLGEGKWNVEYFLDGVNADRIASDYVRTEATLDVKGDGSVKLTLPLAPGGGCAAVFRPAQD